MLFKHGKFLPIDASLMKVFSKFTSVHLNKFKCSECSKQTAVCSAHAVLFVAKCAHLISPQICGLTLTSLKCPLIYRLAVVLIQGAAIRSWQHMAKAEETL